MFLVLMKKRCFATEVLLIVDLPLELHTASIKMATRIEKSPGICRGFFYLCDKFCDTKNF